MFGAYFIALRRLRHQDGSGRLLLDHCSHGAPDDELTSCISICCAGQCLREQHTPHGVFHTLAAHSIPYIRCWQISHPSKRPRGRTKPCNCALAGSSSLISSIHLQLQRYHVNHHPRTRRRSAPQRQSSLSQSPHRLSSRHGPSPLPTCRPGRRCELMEQQHRSGRRRRFPSCLPPLGSGSQGLPCPPRQRPSKRRRV